MSSTSPAERLIIIGNSEPERNYTPLIRDNDIIMRFNKVNHIETGYIGDRTDIIVLVGNWSLRHHGYKGRMPAGCKDAIKKSQQVWFRTSRFGAKRQAEILRLFKLTSHPVTYITKEYEAEILSDQKDQTPSTGFLILKKIWKQNLFPGMEKYLCCLDSNYKKNLHHNIKREGKMINRWVREGKFKRL